MHWNRRVALGYASVVVLLLLAGWLISSGGWPGEPSRCIPAGDCSCEVFSDGRVVQPANTVSSLVFVVAGGGLLWFGRSRLGVVFAGLVAGLGVGSAAFHASVTEWGGWLDLLAIHALVLYVLALDAAMLLSRSRRWVLGFTTASSAVAALILWWLDNGFGKYTLAGLVAVVALLEWRLRSRRTGRDIRRLGWAVGLGAAGLLVQWLGRGGGPLCDPDGAFQVHAAWHVIAAAAAVMLYRYLFVEPTRGSVVANSPPEGA